MLQLKFFIVEYADALKFGLSFFALLSSLILICTSSFKLYSIYAGKSVNNPKLDTVVFTSAIVLVVISSLVYVLPTTDYLRIWVINSYLQ